MAELPALGDSAAGLVKAREEATAAMEARRLHLALDRLAMQLELGPGLIYRATMAAKIKDQVADTFYLKDIDGKKIKDSNRLERLRQAILEAVRGPLDGGGRG